MKLHHSVVWTPKNTDLFPRDTLIPAGTELMGELMTGNTMLVHDQAIQLLGDKVARVRFAFTTLREIGDNDTNRQHELVGIDEGYTRIGQPLFSHDQVMSFDNPFDSLFEAYWCQYLDDTPLYIHVGDDRLLASHDIQNRYMMPMPVGIVIDSNEGHDLTLTFHYLVFIQSNIQLGDLEGVYSIIGEYVFQESLHNGDHKLITTLAPDVEVPDVIIDANRALMGYLREHGVVRFFRGDAYMPVEV